MVRRSLPGAFVLVAAGGLVTGCGGNSSGTTSTQGTTQAAPYAVPSAATSTGSSALTAEAHQIAAGDIPDNQVFLTFRNGSKGYVIKYPEGWA